jgi:geranylgeranyl diphosphate synthase, type I
MHFISFLRDDRAADLARWGLPSPNMATHAATGGQANLGRIRTEVARALEQFLARQRETLAAVGPDLLPCLDAMEGLLAGGKRLRPAFCYWGWRAAGGSDCPEIFTAASALELLQASALVHDDVMDASDTRRGNPAVHRQFGNRFAAGKLGPAARFRSGGKPLSADWTGSAGRAGSARAGSAEQFGIGAAILVGDMLLAWTDELYHASGFAPQVLASGQPALNAMRTEVAAGQYLDLLSQVSHNTSVRAALRVVTYKTAKYTIERPLQLGVALAVGAQTAATPADRSAQARAGVPRETEAARTATTIEAVCTEFGIPLGIAFQLRDDVLGVFGDPARTGKPVSGDISEGKRTVLMAIARERANKSQARVLDRHLGDRSLTEAAAARVKAVLVDTGAVAECEALIGASVKEAVAALDGAPIAADAKAALAALAVTATDREE